MVSIQSPNKQSLTMALAPSKAPHFQNSAWAPYHNPDIESHVNPSNGPIVSIILIVTHRRIWSLGKGSLPRLSGTSRPL